VPPGECRRGFLLHPDRPTLLVTGGSQGASSINRFLVAFARARASALTGWQVIHQTGASGPDAERDEVAAVYRDLEIPAHVTEFLEDMGRAWGAADLCVCRAGAGNVGEAWATRTPCVFMPYPFHKDAHQRANALPLVQAGAAVLAHDAVDPGANLEEAGSALAELLADPAARAGLRAALESLGPADGAQRVARAIGALLASPAG
jgi:UDP-N-acetylglucosamine--N-acetylmuramyl-(pentapeptide) pyrophosphoryl-undecaprenol N-acetylglucosamine transferase